MTQEQAYKWGAEMAKQAIEQVLAQLQELEKPMTEKQKYMTKCLYLIGSLRNERIPKLAQKIRKDNPDFEVFDDWYSAGPEADDFWKAHQKGKGLTYQEALAGPAARNVFSFDKRHLDRSTHALLVLPAGKSGHMEITYAAYGVGARTAILLDPKDCRWDVMYQFIPTILNNDKEINGWLQSKKPLPNAAGTMVRLDNMHEFHRI